MLHEQKLLVEDAYKYKSPKYKVDIPSLFEGPPKFIN